MIGITLAIWAAAVLFPAPQPAPDLHLTLKSEFEYMSRIRPLTQEWWIGDRRSRLTQGDRVSIVREDLGLSWRIDTKQQTYTEAKRPTEAEKSPATAAAAPAVDMHTAGWSWEATFEWTVKETGNTAVIAGRPCREFRAEGDADYSEASTRFWGCEPIPGVETSPNDALIGAFRNESLQKMMADTARRNGGLWLLQAEDREEPAIAPTLVWRVKVESLEAIAAPAGTFDLPGNVKKAGR